MKASLKEFKNNYLFVKKHNCYELGWGLRVYRGCLIFGDVLEPAKTIGVWNVHAFTKSLTVMSQIRRDIKPLLQHNSGNNLIFVPWLQSIDMVYVCKVY